MSRGRVAALLAILTLVAIARIAATYPVFSLTADEPYHIAAGLEWLTQDSYRVDPEHPPLARIGFALDAWLAGTRLDPALAPVQQGAPIVYRDAHVVRNVTAARVANLPWFLLAMAIVFLWTRWVAGTGTALLAVALFGALPPTLAHAGLATTDMAATATVAAALYAFSRWLDEPRWSRAAVLSLALTVGMASKFSFIAYFGVGALVLLGSHLRSSPGGDLGSDLRSSVDLGSDLRSSRSRRGQSFAFFAKTEKRSSDPITMKERRCDPIQLGVAATATVLMVIALYKFNVTGYFSGLQYLADHSGGDHRAFLFGEIRQGGWWYYFPVILFFKTPIAFLLLAGTGMVILARLGRWDLALIPVAMLGMAMTSRINIGVRHLLPIYPLLAMAAAVAVVWGWKGSRTGQVLSVTLAGWLFVATALAHPDYLSYFNEMAGRHPERIASDSNLDWGQDLYRLAGVVERERLAPIHLAYFGWADPGVHIPHARPLPLGQCVTGWVVLSEMKKIAEEPQAYAWLDAHQPVRRIGASLRLYSIPECR
ncbi:MAG TPA: glycosyltransferase family 39 protein [Thermoanaerobaculia bacterium]|nr:glycosyltransferase family 39 protein [Thermoanaerobaculia bacterium]